MTRLVLLVALVFAAGTANAGQPASPLPAGSLAEIDRAFASC